MMYEHLAIAPTNLTESFKKHQRLCWAHVCRLRTVCKGAALEGACDLSKMHLLLLLTAIAPFVATSTTRAPRALAWVTVVSSFADIRRCDEMGKTVSPWTDPNNTTAHRVRSASCCAVWGLLPMQTFRLLLSRAYILLSVSPVPFQNVCVF